VRDTAVCRNYAETLLAVAEKERQVERYGELIDTVAGVLAADPALRGVFMSPRVPKQTKQRLIEQALSKVAPVSFVRFLQVVVQRGRQYLLTGIAEEYELLVDLHLNRVHAVVATARPVDEKLAAAIGKRLTEVFAKEVLPHFRADPALLGGIVVRVGDRVFDGSLRRKLKLLQHRMLHAPLGETAAAE
jgi:F-type H+-transporting ATPase subunit delta